MEANNHNIIIITVLFTSGLHSLKEFFRYGNRAKHCSTQEELLEDATEGRIPISDQQPRPGELYYLLFPAVEGGIQMAAVSKLVL